MASCRCITYFAQEYFVQQRPMELLQSSVRDTEGAHAPSCVSRAVQAEFEWNTRHVFGCVGGFALVVRLACLRAGVFASWSRWICNGRFVTLHRVHCSYVMNMAMLPKSYFPPEAAAKILFIGKALQILRRRYGAVTALPEARDPAHALGPSDAAHQFRRHEALFGRLFAALKRRPQFDVYVLGKAIEQMRRIVAKHLWRVVVSASVVAMCLWVRVWW